MDHHPVGSMGVAHLQYGVMPFYHTSPLGSGSTSPPTNHLMMGVPDPRMLAHSSSEPDFSDRDREQHLPVNKRRKVVYLCESCGTSYTEKRALARHKHTNQHRRNLGLPPAQRYPCTTCDKSFSRDHDRVRHENETHKGFKRSAQRGGTVASSSHSESPPPLPLKDASNASDSFSSTDGDSHNTPASSATSHSRNSSNAFVSGTGADACDWHGGAGEPPQMKGPATYHFSPPLAHAKSTPSFNTSGSGIHMGSMQDRSWFNEDDSDSDESPDANNRRLALQSGDDDDDAAGDNNEDDDGDDDDDDDDEYLRGLVYPPMRSTSTADSAIDMEWSQEREPKFPTIVTYDHRGESSDRDTIADEQWDQLAPLSTSVAQSRLKPSHKSAIVRHGTTQMIAARSPLFCAFCKTPFEDDPETLLPHLRKHLESLKGEHRCKTCDIGFTHRADLDRHNASVDFFGYCGFSFNHTKPCTGHHPPSQRRSTEVMGDHDSVQLFAQLRNWEHAQLRTYIAEIQDLLSTRSSRASACYSVDALYRRSRDSFASVAVSINTLESAPCDGGGDTKRGMGGLQQRLRMMSLKNSANPPSASKGHRHELRPNKNAATMLM